ncbi:hypothetical protein RRG08_062672 [Elysia crispata]|uniref:Uncharacterized protein n=1 Tax=Elysia crispata TaxID=231223 RepID=A0AAE0XM68_9GAST|nr:hypothetical protein RRG08_062672 [Elysia crispata]
MESVLESGRTDRPESGLYLTPAPLPHPPTAGVEGHINHTATGVKQVSAVAAGVEGHINHTATGVKQVSAVAAGVEGHINHTATGVKQFSTDQQQISIRGGVMVPDREGVTVPGKPC